VDFTTISSRILAAKETCVGFDPFSEMREGTGKIWFGTADLRHRSPVPAPFLLK
jgi:hypothetical protein